MELWIRSQKNKELRPLLLKVNELEIGDYDGDMNCIVVNNLHCVGVYKTKERALEVLDEIQYKINNYVADVCVARYIYVGESQEPTYIYEMPKE